MREIYCNSCTVSSRQYQYYKVYERNLLQLVHCGKQAVSVLQSMRESIHLSGSHMLGNGFNFSYTLLACLY